MSYKTRRYKDGLAGEKPGLLNDLFDNKEERRAKEAGYRDYLRNQDLAERIREPRRSRSSGSSDYGSSSSAPPTLSKRIISGIVGVAIMLPFWAFYGDLLRHGISTGNYMEIFASIIAAAVWSIPGILLLYEAFSSSKEPQKH